LNHFAIVNSERKCKKTALAFCCLGVSKKQQLLK